VLLWETIMNPYLKPSLEFGPVVVQRQIRLIPTARWDEPLETDRFTPREVVAHLADWEPILRERILTALRAPGAPIEAYDEAEMARQNHYDTSDPEAQCALFLRERHETARMLRELAPTDWSKTVQHPERGTLSVEDQANLLLGHDLYHIEQLSAYLAP